MKTIFKVFSVDFFAKVVMMLITVILIRIMNEQEYANYSVILAVTNLFNSIVISSFGKMYIVDYDRFKDLEYTLFLSIVIIGLGLDFTYSILNANSLGTIGVISIFILTVAMCFYCFSRIIFQQACNFRYFSFLEIVRMLGFAILIFIGCVVTKNSLNLFSVILFQSFAMSISLIILLKKTDIAKWRKKINFKRIFEFVIQKEQFLFFVYAVLMSIMGQLDILLLRNWSDDLAVATYSSALKYYNIFLMVLTTVNSVLLPKISGEKDYSLIKKTYKQLDFLAVFLAIGVIIAEIGAPLLIPIIDGGKYPGAVSIFRILIISAWISFVSSPYNNFLIKENKMVSICIRMLIGIIIIIYGNYILIPICGVNGTAIVTLIAYAVQNGSGRIHATIIINERIRNKAESKQIVG